MEPESPAPDLPPYSAENDDLEQGPESSFVQLVVPEDSLLTTPEETLGAGAGDYRLSNPDDEGDGEEAGDHAAPLGMLVAPDEAEAHDDDATEVAFGATVQAPADVQNDEEGAGSEEPWEDLVAGELPALDADAEGDFEQGIEPPWLPGLDRARPPWLERRWRVESVLDEPVAALLVAGGRVVAGGRTLHALRGAVPSFEAPGMVRSLGAGPAGELLVGTTRGALFVERDGTLEAVALPGSAGDTEASPLLLAQHASHGRLVARGRALFASDDGGSSWRVVRVCARPVLVAGSDPALWILADDRVGRVLLRSADHGRSFEALNLDEATRFVCGGEEPFLAAAGGVLVVGDSARGVRVTRDGGGRFESLSGISGVSAVALAPSRRRAWLACHDDLAERTEFVEVDLGSLAATRLAELPCPPGEDALPLVALAWDEHAERLLAAGERGVFAVSPPRGPAPS